MARHGAVVTPAVLRAPVRELNGDGHATALQIPTKLAVEPETLCLIRDDGSGKGETSARFAIRIA